MSWAAAELGGGGAQPGFGDEGAAAQRGATACPVTQPGGLTPCHLLCLWSATAAAAAGSASTLTLHVDTLRRKEACAARSQMGEKGDEPVLYGEMDAPSAVRRPPMALLPGEDLRSHSVGRACGREGEGLCQAPLLHPHPRDCREGTGWYSIWDRRAS